MYDRLEIETTVKGGMPVIVTADADSESLCNVTVRWTSGKPVTDKFEASLSKQDWASIFDELNAAL